MNRAKTYDPNVVCIADLKKYGSEKLLPMARDFFNGYAMEGKTYHDNISSFDNYKICPRVMIDNSTVDTTTECFGAKVAFPLGFSPACCHKLAHEDGEAGTSRAAAKKGVNMILSGFSTTPIPEVIQAGDGSQNAYAQQLNLMRDEEANLEIIRNAEKSGYKAIFITVDTTWLGRRLNELKNGFHLPDHLGFANYPWINRDKMEDGTDQRSAFDTTLTWERVKYFKSKTSLPIWLKGILTPEDAALAVEAGADGIIVSNHGGRQMDETMSTLDALPDVVAAVKGRIPVHIDGGIRKGSDIFKALALGADHCWVGRIPLWGLAYNGEAGVSLALDILYDEFQTTMALAGCTKVEDIGPQYLAKVGLDGSVKRLKVTAKF